MLTDAEFWRLRGLIDAHGVDGACARLRLTERELCDVQYPGDDEVLARRVRERLPLR